MADDHDHGCGPRGGFLSSPAGLVMIAFLAIAGFYLWTEHRAHLLGALLWLPLLACPLMHLFMHHGHGKHGEDGRPRQSNPEQMEGAGHER